MKKIKVSYLGLNSLFGRVTTNLLKQSPCIHKLTLYDDGAPPHAIEHPNVFFGRDSLQDAIKDVNIVVIGDEGGVSQDEDRLRVIGPKVIRYTEAIIKFSPNAIVIVAASPLNILFPLIGNFLGPDWQDRLLGTTSVDTLRASRALDGLLNDPQGQTHILPVIGGASYSTRVPLFSHICPQITISSDIRDNLVEKMKLFDCSDSQDMDSIERAYSTVRFIHSVLTGMTRDTSVPEIAMTKTSGIPQTSYFSLPILIGRKGIERAADLPKLDEAEKKLFLEAAQELSEESQKAVVLSTQSSNKNRSEDPKKETLLGLKNIDVHEDEGKALASESQLKETNKDPVRYSFRGGRSKKRRKSGRKSFLGLPCAEKAPASSSPGISKFSETEANITKDEPVSEYSEILNKDVSDHLTSLNFGPGCSQQKLNLPDENTDDEFTETLQFEVEEHLNALKHGKQPHNLNARPKLLETMVSGVDAEGRSKLESRSASDQFIVLSSDNKSDGSGTTESSKITPSIQTTPFKRMNTAIMDSKPINKFGSKSTKSTDRPNISPVPMKSPSVKIDSAIADSRIRSPANDSIIGLDLAKHEEKDAKKELRPDSDAVEKFSSDSLAGANLDSKKWAHEEDLNLGQTLRGDAKRELRPPDGTAHKVRSRSQTSDLPVQENAKKYPRPRDNEFANDRRTTARDTSLMLSTDAKMELRPREHLADASRIKIENANMEMTADAEKELRPRAKSTGRAGVEQNVILATDDAKKELLPRDESADESSLPKINPKRQAGTKVRPKVRGKVNSQVLTAFEADRSSGDHMSKSQIMMLKRKKKNEEKTSKDKQQKLVGEDGDAGKPDDAAKPDDSEKVNSKMNSDELAASSDSATKSSNAKARISGRIGRRAVPLRRSSDKRKHRGKNKMVFSEGKWRTQAEDDGAIKDSDVRVGPAELTSETVKNVPNVPTNTSRRMNTAINDAKVRAPRRRTESWNSSHNPQSLKFSDESHDALPDARGSVSGSLTSKRIDGAIMDAKASTRQRSPSPKGVDFKPSHKQPDVSSHLLTDAARVAKLNSLHKTSSEEFNIEKTADNNNIRFEPDFKLEVSKKPLSGENKKKVSKPPSIKPKSQKPDQTKSSRNLAEDTEDIGTSNVTDKDLTSDKTMNYFMRQQTKGPIDLKDSESTEVPIAERQKHKKRQSGRDEGKTDQRKKPKRPKHYADPETKNVSKINRNSVNYSKIPNQPEKITPTRIKHTTKKESDLEPEDPWDSKYFTKASEMFFKMFRDTVTCTAPKFAEGNHPLKANSQQSHNVFLGQPQKHTTEMKANPFQGEQLHKNDTSGAYNTQGSQFEAKKNISETVRTADSDTISAGQNSDNSLSKNGKTSPGKIKIRFDKPIDVKCKMHPEASTKTSDMCENVTFHVNTRNPLPNYKESPKEEYELKNSNEETIVSFDKLYEESSTVPLIVGNKGEKSWRSLGTGEKAREKYAPSEVLHGVVATSDKGRGDASNKVDFTVCRMPDQSNFGKDAQKIGESSKSKNGRNGNSIGLKAPPMKIPIMSKTIKQVSIPYQVEVSNRTEDTLKPDKSYRWERIVNVFKNIIISDIEGKRPRFLLENHPTVPTVSTANIAKSVPPPPKKPEAKVSAQETKRGVFKVKSKSSQAKQRKYETAKKKRPSDSKIGHVIKNNPKKIVNYFSKRGASASSYERPRFDGQHFDQSERLMSQTSANMEQNCTSFASPSKIK